jgi:hypothetical protein
MSRLRKRSGGGRMSWTQRKRCSSKGEIITHHRMPPNAVVCRPGQIKIFRKSKPARPRVAHACKRCTLVGVPLIGVHLMDVPLIGVLSHGCVCNGRLISIVAITGIAVKRSAASAFPLDGIFSSAVDSRECIIGPWKYSLRT